MNLLIICMNINKIKQMNTNKQMTGIKTIRKINKEKLKVTK